MTRAEYEAAVARMRELATELGGVVEEINVGADGAYPGSSRYRLARLSLHGDPDRHVIVALSLAQRTGAALWYRPGDRGWVDLTATCHDAELLATAIEART